MSALHTEISCSTSSRQKQLALLPPHAALHAQPVTRAVTRGTGERHLGAAKADRDDTGARGGAVAGPWRRGLGSNAH
eukprot:4273124-Pleurochrysis_carterae.AAC.2